MLSLRTLHHRAQAHSGELELLNKYAGSPPRPINLSQLLSFGRPVSADSVLASVSYTLAELPRRLATRVRSLEALPFIVGTNPYIAKSLNAYKDSFTWLATHPPVTTTAQNDKFVHQLADLVQKHTHDIPTMAKGFQECSRYMSPTQISSFLDGAIRNRISVRLIAEQHITLSKALSEAVDIDSYVGVVDSQCSPAKMISMCGSFVSELCEATLGASPNVVVDGNVGAVFPYVPVHLEYILTEILKNSFRATVEHHYKTYGTSPAKRLPPVIITLSQPNLHHEHYFSIRVRDQGGGVSPTNMARIFSYAFTTAGRGASTNTNDVTEGGPYAAQHVGGMAAVEDGTNGLFREITGKGLQTGLGTIAGLGYGLPMSKLYAKYFGGSLDLLSLEGWGSDVFLKLRCLDEAGDSTI